MSTLTDVHTSGQRALELLDQALCAKDGELDRAAQTWLQEGLRRYVREAGDTPLATCLGLAVGQGERSIPWRLEDARRNAAIVAAWRALPEVNGLTDERRIEILLAELELFERDYLAQWLEQRPARPSQLRGALFAVFTASSRRPPRTVKGMRELLTRVRELT